MKKIILVILLLLCIGCSSTSRVQVKDTNICAVKFEYEGHSYIQFNDGRNVGYVHDPDCWCMIDYD